jgi:hypothetical protein
VCSGFRTSPVTRSPRAVSNRARRSAICPCAPAIVTFTLFLLLVAGAAESSRQSERGDHSLSPQTSASSLRDRLSAPSPGPGSASMRAPWPRFARPRAEAALPQPSTRRARPEGPSLSDASAVTHSSSALTTVATESSSETTRFAGTRHLPRHRGVPVPGPWGRQSRVSHGHSMTADYQPELHRCRSVRGMPEPSKLVMRFRLPSPALRTRAIYARGPCVSRAPKLLGLDACLGADW